MNAPNGWILLFHVVAEKHGYDVVIGAMADDQIYSYVSDYIDGTITREQF